MDNITAKKKITLMLDVQVYEGIKAKVGSRGIGAYLSRIARPHVAVDDLDAGYKAMAADVVYNQCANEWIDGMLEPIIDENNW